MTDPALPSVGGFLESLASGEPTPGGGSASALAVALGGALVAMVARLSRKEGGEAASAIAAQADELRVRATDLIDVDARAFEAVLAAYRLPRTTPEEKAARAEAVQRALVTAGEVPLDAARTAAAILEAAQNLAGAANPNAISDLGVAAHLAGAGAEGALLNVAINLKGMTAAAASDLRGQAGRVGAEVAERRAAVLDAVRQRMEG